MRRTTVLAALLMLILPPAAKSAEVSHDWPQWRGIHRNAVSEETGLIDRWPETGPRVVWRLRAGAGFSSVSVAGDALYTMWDEDGRQFLLALDSGNGKELWRLELGAGFKNNFGDGPRSTPLVDGGLVFAVGTQGSLVAADRETGKLAWQRDLVGDLGGRLPTYGYSSSPLVVGERLLIEAGGESAAFVALDKKTGEVAWSSQSDLPAYSSPIEVTVDGVRQAVFWSAHGLHALAPEDGALLWKYPWETFCSVSGDPLNTGTPIFIAPDRIFLSSGSGAAVIRLSREGGAFSVETVWKSRWMRSDVNTALLLGDYVYGFDRSLLECLDVRTGEVQWRARGFSKGSLIAADGKLIVLGESGNLAIVDPNPEEFTVESEVKILQGKNWTTPSLAGGRLFLRNHEELVCLDMRESSREVRP